MAKVLSGDLSSANSDNMSNIELVITTASNLKTLISGFISESPSELKGGGYDNVRIKLSLYEKILSVLITIGENLINNIKNVNNQMINYMEGYSLLDDALLPEINQQLSQIKAYLSYLESINGTTDSNGNVIDVSAEIAQYTAMYNELKHYRDLLSGLAAEDASLFGILENIINDVENLTRSANGINADTFTKNGLIDLKNNPNSIYNFNPNEEVFSEEFKTPPEIKTYGGKYTRDQIESMSEEEVRNMSNEEFIEFIGAAAQLVYEEYGGPLPSITIAQALLESGFGDHFENTSHNVYGLIGYPDEKGKVNRLKKFDNFYEATVYHATYFEAYKQYYPQFLAKCAEGDAIGAAAYLGAYAGGSQTYGPSIQALIRNYNLTEYDNI